MRIVNSKQFNPDTIDGNQPEVLFSLEARPDGDAFPWKDAAIGTINVARITANQVEVSVKNTDTDTDYDWQIVSGTLTKRLTKADFTDGGGASGTYTFAETIPLGAIVDYTTIRNVVAFSGDTTAVVIVGTATPNDTDRYMTGTPSVFATITYLSVGAVSGTAYHAAAASPVVTVTGGSDFGALATTGALTVSIHYYN